MREFLDAGCPHGRSTKPLLGGGKQFDSWHVRPRASWEKLKKWFDDPAGKDAGGYPTYHYLGRCYDNDGNGRAWYAGGTVDPDKAGTPWFVR